MVGGDGAGDSFPRIWGFNSRSGYISRLWVWSLVQMQTIPGLGMYGMQSMDTSLSYQCFSLFLHLPLKAIIKCPWVRINKQTNKQTKNPRVQEEQEKDFQDFSGSLSQVKNLSPWRPPLVLQRLSVAYFNIYKFIFLSKRMLILLLCPCTHPKDYWSQPLL